MIRKDDRPEATPRDAARMRTLIGTAIGLCLAVRPAASTPASQILHFTARPTLSAMLLTWTVPPVTTFTRLVIRFRVDGKPPSSPSDGFSLYDSVTPPGALYSTHHSGLSPRHSYSYAAFALDDAGNVQESTTAVGVPLENQPPGVVQNLRRVDLDGATCGPVAGSRR